MSDLPRPRWQGVSFDLRPGEILGIGGLAGQGQHDLFMTLFGAEGAARPDRESTAGPPHPQPGARRSEHGLGIALVPEDRKTEGLMLRCRCATT